MALYRQIAGNGMPSNQVGLSITQIFDATRDAIAPLLPTPVDYTPVDAPFTDPREWNPIPQYKPPFEPIDLGPSVFHPTVTPSNPLPPDPGTTPTPLPTDPTTAITNNILPLVALAGVVLVAIKGNDLLPKRRKIALLGGLGLLYYGMAKNKLV